MRRRSDVVGHATRHGEYLPRFAVPLPSLAEVVKDVSTTQIFLMQLCVGTYVLYA